MSILLFYSLSRLRTY